MSIPAVRDCYYLRMESLIGVGIVVLGFLLRLNPLLVVTVGGFATGLAGGLGPVAVVEAFGKSFIANRFVATYLLVFPVIGLLERSGLRERAKILISRVKAATAGRVLLIYLAVRQIMSAVGLYSLGGHAQMVRPLIAPMAEGAAEAKSGPLPDETRYLIRAHSAAADNVGYFFGEDVFIAIGSILLMKGFLDQNGITVEPLHLALWAIPTAVIALIVHGTRLLLLDRVIARQLAAHATASRAAVQP
jgi:uncharacterized membrane protein